MKQEPHNSFHNFRIVLAIAWKDILEGWKNKVILTSVITSLFLVVFYTYMPDLTRGDELPLMVIFDPNNYITNEETACIKEFNYRVEKLEQTFNDVLRDLDTPVIGIKLEEDPLQHQPDSLSFLRHIIQIG